MKQLACRPAPELYTEVQKKINQEQRKEMKEKGFKYTTRDKVGIELWGMYVSGKIKMPWE